MSRRPLLDVRDLHVDFAGERDRLEVVSGVSFQVNSGETVGLVGESGSGKTVTGLSIMRLIPDPPGRITGGVIDFDGTDLLGVSERQMRDVRGAQIGMIFQDPMTSLSPAFTVGDQIAETVRRHLGLGRRGAWQKAVKMLELVGIPSAERRARSYPHEFSGGMRQRVVIAIALCCEPRLLIADEPTTALDVTIQAQILDLINSLRAEMGMSVIFVTHDLGVVAEVCDRVVVMYAGQVVETAAATELYKRPLHPYTEGLLTSLPQFDVDDQMLFSIPGTVPPAGHMPTGCRFHTRCSYCQPECLQTIHLDEVNGRQVRCVRSENLVLEGTE